MARSCSPPLFLPRRPGACPLSLPTPSVLVLSLALLLGLAPEAHAAQGRRSDRSRNLVELLRGADVSGSGLGASNSAKPSVLSQGQGQQRTSAASGSSWASEAWVSVDKPGPLGLLQDQRQQTLQASKQYTRKPPPSGKPAPCNELCDVNRRLLKKVNAFRASSDIAPLCLNNKLIAAAKVQAQYMSRQRRFSHLGPNNSTLPKRVQAQGFKWTAVAENIAKGYSTLDAFWNAVVNSGLRTNAQGPYKYTGVYQQGRYWTHVFAAGKQEACNN